MTSLTALAPIVSDRMSESQSVLSAETLKRRICDCIRIGNAARLDLLDAIRQLMESGLQAELGGYNSVQTYLQEEHRFSRSDASRYCAIAKALPDLPRLRVAFEESRVSWSDFREITRVANFGTEERWIEFAREGSHEALAAEVMSAHREGRDAPRADRHALPAQTVRISFALTADEYEAIQPQLAAAREKLKSRPGSDDDPEGPATDGRVLEALLEHFFSDSPRAESPTGDSPISRIPKAVVYQQCPDCRASAVHTDRGLVELSPERVDRVAPEAEVVTVSSEEVIEPATVPTGDRLDPPTPPALRHRVLLCC